MGFAGAMVGWLLAWFDYAPEQVQSEFTLTGLALMLTIIPGVFHFLVGWLMNRYRITDAEYQRLVLTLDAEYKAPGESHSNNEEHLSNNQNMTRGVQS